MLRFVPRQIPNQIFVIGCGGTGSRLVPLLAQFVKTITHGVSPRGVIINPTIYLIDDDVVEHKNLARQNFIESDVGKPKAAVLATRYARAFGVNIIPVVARVDQRRTFYESIRETAVNPGSNSVLIMCVDSAQARRDILAAWTGLPRHSYAVETTPFVIDAGNEDDFGQVRFFNLVVSRGKEDCDRLVKAVPALTPVPKDIHFIPMDTEFYRDLRDNEGGSCADLDQTLAINALMATMIMGVVQNFYYIKPFPYYSMGISLKSGASNSMITPAYLAGVSLSERSERTPVVPNALLCSMRDDLTNYRLENTNKLREMGLRADGTPIPRVTPQPTPDVAQVEARVEEPVAELTGEVTVEPTGVEIELGVAPAPTPVRRRRNTRPIRAVAPVLPEGVSEPPPLTPVRP